MKITVITVCFNASATIRAAIESVAAQTHPDIEHWVIDGASTDGTAEKLAEWQQMFGYQLVSEPDQGLYYAMNKGIARATGEVIGFLNADDYYAFDTVLADVAEALSDPKVDGCYADLNYVSQEDLSKVIREWKSEAFEPGAFFRGWMLPHPTFYARREIYDQWGDFDTQFRFGADWELLFRFFEVAKISVVHVPRLWIIMQMGGQTNRSLGNIITNHRECLRAFRKHGYRSGLIFPFRKVWHRLCQFRLRSGKSEGHRPTSIPQFFSWNPTTTPLLHLPRPLSIWW